MEQYDLIVLGAGPVGENVADYAVRHGLSAAIVEHDAVGGDCSYRACIPSKALIRPGEALSAARSLSGAAQAMTGTLDAHAVLERRDGFISRTDSGAFNDSGQANWLSDIGVELIRGRGRIVGPRRVDVESPTVTRSLSARHAVAVCTGSDPLLPPVPGLADVEAWTADDATTSEEIPESLAILGGGAVASEMATAYAQLGSSVTVIARSGLLSSHEDFAGDAVETGLAELGCTVRRGTVASVRRADHGVELSVDSGPQVVAERVLLATGRRPRTSGIGMDAVGLDDGAWIDVDDSLRARDVPDGWLYAVGDVNGRALLTHQGKYQARAAAAAIAARARGDDPEVSRWSDAAASADHRAVPSMVFSRPQVAQVGLTAEQARKGTHPVRVVDVDLGSVAGAVLHADGYRGTLRAVVDAERGVLCGATIVGADVAEMLHAATIMVAAEVPLTRLWHAVPAFPTMSEAWLRVLERLRAGEASS